MKQGTILFLQIGIVLIGITAFAFLLWEPHLEGRNADATLFEIYFNDPFLAFVYLGSIPFFVGLYQAFKVLRYVRERSAFSLATMKSLRTIKYCALITAGAIVAVDIFLVVHARLYPEPGAIDGPEGAVMLGIIGTFASLVIAILAGMFERTVRDVVERETISL